MSDSSTINNKGDDDSVTIVLDDTNDDSSIQEVFQPVRPGGVKLDETVELVSSSEEEDEVEDNDESHYTTTAAEHAEQFQTPAAAPPTNHLLQRTVDHEESFRGLRPTSNSTPTVPAAPTPQQHPEDDPFAIKDEFLEDSLAGGAGLNTTAQGVSFVSGPKVVSVTPSVRQPSPPAAKKSSPDMPHMRNDDEQVDSAICSTNPSPINDEEEEEEETKVIEISAGNGINYLELLPKTCSVLKANNGGTLYLVGTAHFSEESQKDVVETIRLVRPDVIALELCKARSGMLNYDEKFLVEQSGEINLGALRRSMADYGAVQGAVNYLMTAMAADLTRKLGMAPGGEFRAGYKEALKLPHCHVELADRPIKTTIKRAVNSLSMWQKTKLVFNLLTTNEDFTKEDIERMKEKDMLEQLMEGLEEEFPVLTEVLVRERDLYMAVSLRACLELAAHDLEKRGAASDAPAVVGIVGMGHVKGITEHWERVGKDDIARISVIPRPGLGERMFVFGVRLAVPLALMYGGYRVLRGPATRLIEKCVK